MQVLFIHDVVPRGDRSGSELRVLQIIYELLAQRHEVAYLARFGLCHPKYVREMERLGVRVFVHDCEHLRFQGIDAHPQWMFEEVLRERLFDLAILSVWFWNGISVAEHYMGEIRSLSPGTKIAVLTDDRHGLRESRLAELTNSVSDWERAQDYHDREHEIYRRADLVLSVSRADRAGLLSVSPQLRIEVVSMVAEGDDCDRGFHDREGLLFLGDFDNAANHDALAWFLQECWGAIREQLGNVHFSIVGNNAPELADPDRGIVCKGYLEHLDDVFCKARVFVCPARFGTGIATKNLLALKRRLPVVTTSIGAEGLIAQSGKHALISDTPQEFIESVVRLYTDPQLWQRISDAGRELVLQMFSRDALRSQLCQIIQNLTQVSKNPGDVSEWSVLAVEKHYPDVLTFQPAHNRLMRRCWAHTHFADHLMSQGKPTQALSQIRHVFSFFRNKEQVGDFYLSVMNRMGDYYRELGNGDAAKRCIAEL